MNTKLALSPSTFTNQFNHSSVSISDFTTESFDQKSLDALEVNVHYNSLIIATDFDDATDIEVAISSLIGNEVFYNFYPGLQNAYIDIQLDDFQPGVYKVKIKRNNQLTRMKIIIKPTKKRSRIF